MSEYSDLLSAYRAVRSATERICALEPDDYLLQSMPDASPPKWQLAHTTWFFETFVLERFQPGFEPFDPVYRMLFNSYYQAVGERWPRPQRGLLARPTVRQVYDYRSHVDRGVQQVLEQACGQAELADVVTLGLHHEQQHQELIVTDLKHAWALNPLRPSLGQSGESLGKTPSKQWMNFDARLARIGHAGPGFSFDNETPSHRQFVDAFALASRLVTCGEFAAFIADGGYRRPELWVSDGWHTVQSAGWQAPLYWERDGDAWAVVTLNGRRPIDADEPVCHVSYYEADALARWGDARLPTEAEWEVAAQTQHVSGHFQEYGCFHPSASPAAEDVGPVYQLFGDVWQWTASPYIAYRGYRPATGALGEYNGKFMCNQVVLRGASCATPRSHARRTYRNFFPADARWQFAGLRLAKDLP